ncbi:MAG: XRE family transcriptional regulator [Gemmatimonadota bacterium]|nr:XRE family transcriptional regulator [Gemmatimonadota bacterium]
MIQVAPRMLRWARERASLAPAELAKRVGLAVRRVEDWEESGQLPFEHLERLAEKTHTPVGYLFLPEPPAIELPISDFRRVAGEGGQPPSSELIDTIRQCQLRQEWFREHLIAEGAEPLSWVGSANLDADRASIALAIRAALELDRRPLSLNWTEAVRDLYRRTEELGALVLRNGVVGNNTHRKLRVEEFRGFALSDPYAPLVFINAVDSKAAQMFTLVHELCHLWLGQSAVSDADPSTNVATERFCNAVAAETLAPASEFRAAWDAAVPLPEMTARLARLFKVSTLVVLIRAREAGLLAGDVFEAAYAAERERVQAIDARSGGDGGDFYNTQNARLGGRFATAVISSALEGRTPYTEAFRLLGFKRTATFDEYARKLGILP